MYFKFTSRIGLKRVSFSINKILEWPLPKRARVKFPAAGPISMTAESAEGEDPADTIFPKCENENKINEGIYFVYSKDFGRIWSFDWDFSKPWHYTTWEFLLNRKAWESLATYF